jgi:hypothetical protein
MKSEAFAQLMRVSESMPVIDTHEHLPLEGSHIGEKPDVLADYLSCYIASDLRAAGMPEDAYERACDSAIDLMERWALLEPWLERVRNTSYYKSLQIAMRKIHGIDDMTGETIQALQDSFVKSVTDPDYKRRIMKDICHIEKSITCVDDDPSGIDEFFVRTFYPEAWATPWIAVERKTLADYCEAYKAYYQKWRESGMAALKIAMAYSRTL